MKVSKDRNRKMFSS